MRVLGINAIFHDPAADPVVDGTVVAAAKERYGLDRLRTDRDRLMEEETCASR